VEVEGVEVVVEDDFKYKFKCDSTLLLFSNKNLSINIKIFQL
jgi:hypothetical protein